MYVRTERMDPRNLPMITYVKITKLLKQDYSIMPSFQPIRLMFLHSWNFLNAQEDRVMEVKFCTSSIK